MCRDRVSAKVEAVPLSLLAPALCWSCGAAAGGGRSLCRGCRGRLRWAASEVEPILELPAWAPVAYQGPARALVRGLKFRGARGLADELAAAMAAGAPDGLLQGALVPVPLSRARLRERGYDQARVLAGALAERTGLPVAAMLQREGRPGRQSARGRGARLAVAPGSVSARGPAPSRSVLVDDVITTGATLAACAQALRYAGAREVVAVAYARTPGR